MKVLPAELRGDLPSAGELRVHALLGELDQRGVALHSLNVPEHDYKLNGELDFVVVTDRIILCIEVKGGGVSCYGSVWTYTDRHGMANTNTEGPFRQVQTAMHALRQSLARELTPQVFADVAFGWLVVTSDVDLPRMTEWAPETYCGRTALSNKTTFQRTLDTAVRYWLDKQPHRRQLDKTTRNSIVNILRPDFEQVPGMRSALDQLDDRFAKLTQQQLLRLDLILDQPRVVCEGGAGTGKTFLAVEIARRFRLQHKTVALACRSPLLAHYLRSILAADGVDVLDLRGPSEPTTTYDVVVFDEGQDLMSWDLLDNAGRYIRDGWEEGKWIFFHDPNRQSRMYEDLDDDALDLLLSCGPFRAVLRENCRNTREIAFNTRAITGADVGVSTAGTGPSVHTVHPVSVEQETHELHTWLKKLAVDEVADAEITLVSLSGDWKGSSARGLKQSRVGRLQRVESSGWPPDSMSWCSATNIKGLENRFVAVIDMVGLSSEQDIDRLYVAMSRARAGLFMSVPSRFRCELQELMSTNTEAALAALGASHVH